MQSTITLESGLQIIKYVYFKPKGIKYTLGKPLRGFYRDLNNKLIPKMKWNHKKCSTDKLGGKEE
jgi:hypothetical protein